jgi:murein DD-endopeptidase MepM/ murein hydrolase activator NlpD
MQMDGSSGWHVCRLPLWSSEPLQQAKGPLTLSHRPRNGRHRRRRAPIGLPSAVGSLAVVAAASGAVTMPQALGATAVVASDSLSVPERPHSTDTSGALDPVDAAGQSLTAESTQLAKDVNAALVEAERKAAAERAARAERERKKWVLPLASYRISAGFGAVGRLWGSRHTGLDMSTSYGSPVGAMSSGEIIFAGYDGPYGNKIIVEHWDGTETWYCPLSRYTLRSGEVSPGTQIGSVGSTGNSTGPHLHLEVHPGGGDAVNPQSWFAERGLYF